MENNQPDVSNIMEKFNNILKEKNINISEIINNDEKNNPLDFDFDLETIIKFKNIYKKINDNNTPRNRLFSALKPFLRETRKQKIDEYIKIANLIGVINLINDINSDRKGSI